MRHNLNEMRASPSNDNHMELALGGLSRENSTNDTLDSTAAS